MGDHTVEELDELLGDVAEVLGRMSPTYRVLVADPIALMGSRRFATTRGSS